MARGTANKPYGFAFDKLYRRALTGVNPAWNLVASVNNKRRWLYIQSAAAEEVEIGFGTNAAAPHTGFLLAKPSAISNDAIIREWREFSSELGNLTTQAVYARSATGGVQIIIGEADAADVPAEPPAGVSSSSYSASSVSASSASSLSTASSVSASSASTSASSRSASSASSVSASSASSASSVSASSASSASSVSASSESSASSVSASSASSVSASSLSSLSSASTLVLETSASSASSVSASSISSSYSSASSESSSESGP